MLSLFILPLALLSYLLIRVIYRLTRHPLASIPGPPIARSSRLWLAYHAARGDTHLAQLSAHERYGPVVRVGPNHVLLADPALGPQYYSWDKSTWWLCFRPPLEDAHLAFSTELGLREHNAKKKRVAGGYSLTSLLAGGKDGGEGVFDKHISTFLSQMFRIAETGEKVDLGNWVGWLNADLLMEKVFSAPLGCVEQGRDVRGMIAANEGFVKFAQFVGIYPWIFGLMELPVAQAFAPKGSDETGSGVLFGTAERAVAERLKEVDGKARGKEAKQKDMLDSFHQYRDPSTELPIPPRELKNEALVAMLSGADTVSCTLRVAMLQLGTRPDVVRKVRAELESANLTRPIATFDELRQLPYLVATVKELVRFHPPMATPFWRAAPATGITVDGFFIPPHTNVGMNEWVISRDTELYGEDPDVFRPERWLEVDDAKRREREKLDLVFGFGDYACLGKSFTLVESYKVLAEVVLGFEIEVCDAREPWRGSASISFTHEGFWCRVRKR